MEQEELTWGQNFRRVWQQFQFYAKIVILFLLLRDSGFSTLDSFCGAFAYHVYKMSYIFMYRKELLRDFEEFNYRCDHFRDSIE